MPEPEMIGIHVGLRLLRIRRKRRNRMNNRSMVQRQHLLDLARLIASKAEPLGVGLKKGCWAGVAIHIARQHGSKATDYYGLSTGEIKEKIKLNNATPAPLRNAVMLNATLVIALT
jgi:hypothetical protein